MITLSKLLQCNAKKHNNQVNNCILPCNKNIQLQNRQSTEVLAKETCLSLAESYNSTFLSAKPIRNNMGSERRSGSKIILQKSVFFSENKKLDNKDKD